MLTYFCNASTQSCFSMATFGASKASSGSLVSPTRREAYVTMITSDDFLPGVEALLESLREAQQKLQQAPNKGSNASPSSSAPPLTHRLEPRPCVCMVTPDVSARVRGKIGKLGAEVVEVEAIAIPDPQHCGESPSPPDRETPAAGAHAPQGGAASKTHVKSWVATGYSKLGLWGLGDSGGWDAVVYVDADAVNRPRKKGTRMFPEHSAVYVARAWCHSRKQAKLLHSQVVLEDLSEVFDRLGPDCAFTAAPDLFPPDRFNAGVMGVWLGDQPDVGSAGPGASAAEPAETGGAATVTGSGVLMDMKRRLAELGTYDGGDTGFLNRYFSDWYSRPDPRCRLPFRFNAQRTLHWLTHVKQPGYWQAVGLPPAVLHFSSSPKPWQAPKNKGELELVWWRYFMAAQARGVAGFLGTDAAAALAALGGC